MGGTWDIRKIIKDGKGRGILEEKDRRLTFDQLKEKQRLKKLKKRRK